MPVRRVWPAELRTVAIMAEAAARWAVVSVPQEMPLRTTKLLEAGRFDQRRAAARLHANCVVDCCEVLRVARKAWVAATTAAVLEPVVLVVTVSVAALLVAEPTLLVTTTV